MRKWLDMKLRFWVFPKENVSDGSRREATRDTAHTPLEQIAEHGYKVGGRETLFRIDQTTEIHV